MHRSRAAVLSVRDRLSEQTRGKHSLTGDDYQFIHKSVIPSYHFQKRLPRLPIPKLPDTCNRYLASAKSVLSPTQYAQTEKLLRDFEKGDGRVLQKELLAYDKAHKDSSYISEPWFDKYLKDRVPVAVNVNPFMMYAPDPDPKFMDQLTRATNLIISYARFKRALDTNVLIPELYHLTTKSDDDKYRTMCQLAGIPRFLPKDLSLKIGAVAYKAVALDMSQYKSIFNGSRLPRDGKDTLYNDPTQKHFVAMRKGRFYAVRLFDDKGAILPASEVQASLAWVLRQGDLPGGASEAVGSLTSMERDAWAKARAQLEAEGNGASLKAVDGALFTLCLDDLATTDHKRLVQSLLIGDDAANRWFDKCFQLIVDGNGEATLNFEHSWGDGVAVLRLMEESFKDSNKHHFVSPDDKIEDVKGGAVEEIKFKLSDSLKQTIQGAQKTHIAANSDLDYATVQYTGMTRDSIKKFKVSPDSLMELAIQMSFHSLYKEFPPTYESCSTSAFLKGRTETIRCATWATRAATEAIAKGAKGAEAKALIAACSSVHTNLSTEAKKGQGFDRHLLGLRITAERAGRTPHDFYSSEAHARMGHFTLSTSTLSTETLAFGGFGPVVPDGFGIGYNVVGSMLGAVVTSNKSHRDARQFGDALHKSLDELKSILEKKD